MYVQVVAGVLCVHQKQQKPATWKERVTDQLYVFLFGKGGTEKIPYVVGIEGMEHLIRIVPV